MSVILGWLDYGARMYQSEIGRWSSIDPLSENSISMTPYHYVGNSPVTFLDVNGLEISYLVDNMLLKTYLNLEDCGTIMENRQGTRQMKGILKSDRVRLQPNL